MFQKLDEVIGLDTQTALVNSRPPSGDEVEDTRDALAQYVDQQNQMLAKLGIKSATEDVKPDNAKLMASLKIVLDSGAPMPVVVTETIALPTGVGTWTTDVYVFTHFQNPRLQLRATEYLLADQPEVLVEELRVAGIKAK